MNTATACRYSINGDLLYNAFRKNVLQGRFGGLVCRSITKFLHDNRAIADVIANITGGEFIGGVGFSNRARCFQRFYCERVARCIGGCF